MSENELIVIRRLQSGGLKREELIELYHQNQDRYRVLLHLAQHPSFPEAFALGIISKLFPGDLVRVIKNLKTNPFVRKRAEIEFSIRFPKLALGEKKALLLQAPNSLLLYFVNERDPQLIASILRNPQCNEDVILRFINRSQERSQFYRVLDDTDWHMNPAVALAITHDPEAPIKIILKVIPFVGISELRRLAADESLHEIARSQVRRYLENRRGGSG